MAINNATSRKADSTHDAVQLAMMPTQWGSLKDIDDVEPLNPDDYACLAEVRDALKKYGKSERFGVALLHKHFDMADNEVLLENTDQENRIQTLQPILKEELGKAVETLWVLKEGPLECMSACEQWCRTGNLGDHLYPSHRHTPEPHE